MPPTGTVCARLARLLIVLCLVGGVVGCAGEPGGQVHTAPAGAEYNDADLAFATDMIPHHAQALVMVDMTLGRELSPRASALVDQMRRDQTAEIEQMVDWLHSWDRPVPATSRDHANAHGGGQADMHSDLPGMMSADRISRLRGAAPARFEDMWLRMMIEHHEGAIEMAQQEREAGIFAPALKMAAAIERSQQAEIAQMERILGS